MSRIKTKKSTCIAADALCKSGTKSGVDLGNNTGTNGTAAFTDSKAEAFFNGDRGNQLNIHLDVIARHAHLGAFRQLDDTRNVSRSEIELRTIVVEERRMTAAFFLGQNINLTMEFGVRMNGARFAKNLAALDIRSLHAAEQRTDVIASLGKMCIRDRIWSEKQRQLLHKN